VLILVTGATGKVGRRLIERLTADSAFGAARIRALCHNRTIEETDRVEVVRGSLADRSVAVAAIAGATHVVHLATSKETPDDFIDVAVKGLFWLLDEFRQSPTARQFVLIGGDAAVGHYFYRHDGPVTETTRHSAYPGCYALSKVLEEVVLEQFGVQYGINWCCLRAPWIMEKDDFKFTLSFGDDLFGGPDWKTMVPQKDAERYRKDGTVPLLRDADGNPLKRNFVHLDDLVGAIVLALDNPDVRQHLFNICMDEPVDYGAVAAYLQRTRGRDSIDIPSQFHSNWLDNSKAKYALGWRPEYTLERLIESAWEYQRSPNDPRVVWYPG
jgi:nucleoside-diphosphate-sugar epimerase